MSAIIKYPNPDIQNATIIQVLDAPRKSRKSLITNKVTSVFLYFLCSSVTCILIRIFISGFGKYKFVLIMMLCFTPSLLAKIVYISWMEQVALYPASNQLVSLDLDSGRIIKQVKYEGSQFSSITINDSGTYLYVADTNLDRIIQVDSEQLFILQQWINLPTNPETVVLNEANNHLYFANTRSAGSGQDNLYKIDLTNNEMSIANSPVNGLDIKAIFMSKDKSVLYIETYDFVNSEIKHFSFNATDMQLIASATVGGLFKPVFDNSGHYYYGINTYNNTFNAYRITDGSLLWSTPVSIDYPVHFFLDADSHSLLYVDSQKVYKIDKANGNVTLGGDFSMIDSTALVDINEPLIWCITGFCSLSSNLIITKYIPATHSFKNVFSSDFYAGAQDYVFADRNLATPVLVPLFNSIGLLTLIILVLLLTVKFRDRAT